MRCQTRNTNPTQEKGIMKSSSFLLRLQPGMLDFLRHEARRRGMTVSALMRALLTEGLTK
jgi:hypothetical protein